MERCNDCKYNGLETEDEPCSKCSYHAGHFSEFAPKESKGKEVKLCADCRYEEVDFGKAPCLNCFDSKDKLGWKPKEGEKKVKTYKNSEVMAMLEKNPKLIFKIGTTFKLFSEGNVIKVLNVVNNKECAFALDDEWKLVQQGVPFLEAVKALYSGKTIRVETEDKAHSYSPYGNGIRDEKTCAITTSEILKGKWFIE